MALISHRNYRMPCFKKRKKTFCRLLIHV